MGDMEKGMTMGHVEHFSLQEKCVNCGGAHSEGFRDCKARKKAGEIPLIRKEIKVILCESS